MVLIDELCVHGGVEELVVGQHILKEGDVGLRLERQVERRKLSLFNEHFTPFTWEMSTPPFNIHTHSIEKRESQDSNRSAQVQLCK